MLRLIYYDESHGPKTSNFYYTFTFLLKHSKTERVCCLVYVCS
jgi:hypothetical protein